MATQDPNRELQDLLAINRFHTELLEKQLGHKIPVPAEVTSASAANLPSSLDVMRRWLRLLDMAVMAPMMRDCLKDAAHHETAISLYRYYILRASQVDSDRDKTDFISTYLLKTPPASSNRSPGIPGGHSGEAYSYIFSQQQAEEFQKEIEGLLGVPMPELPPEHAQLLREFQFLHQEADDFRHFDQIMDSGILQRVRELKSRFGRSFYHPKVLATSAVYNVSFGKRFDDLFREAASQIKAFASKVQQEGGSIMSRVDGDVTVQNLAEVEASKILKAEYGRAREQLQRVSKFKKAVDSRRSSRPPGVAAAASAAPAPPSVAAAAAARAARPSGVQSLAEAGARGGVPANVVEDNKVRGVAESIRNFVRVAELAVANVVPLRNGNIVLTPAEMEAFKTDFGTEKSFRADYATMLTNLVAMHTRMAHEMDDYKSKRSSSYLWKPHADSMTYLMVAGKRALDEAANICVLAEQRGLGDKAKAMQVTAEKLRTQIGLVAQTLQA